jgi:hypothetical protein
MVLFLIMALVAGYTNRNLVFEQRVAANQYRSTQAFEAAEAALEWGTAMLNAGRVDDACQPVDDPLSVAPSFRQRFLQIDDATGAIAVTTQADGSPLRPACVFDGNAWTCSCPTDAAPVLAAPAGIGSFPAFSLEFVGDAGYPAGVVRLEAVGCTRLGETEVCDPAAGGEGRARVSVLVALKSGLTTPPAASVTAQGALDIGAGLLEAFHADPSTGGLTLHAGGAVSGTPIALHTAPGSAPEDSVAQGDASLAALGVERMFATVFGMARTTYREQPGTVIVDCALDCTAERVRDLARLNPGRMLWIDGDFELDIADAIGSVNQPVLLVVDGTFGVDDPAAQVVGAVYAVDGSWTSTAGSGLTLRGALVAESGLSLSGAGRYTVIYDRPVLTRLRTTHGSFVHVPGSWKDF